MKIIILFSSLFLMFGFTSITVTDKDGKLIAGDAGKNITILKLKNKMLKKGIDISDSAKYTITEKDLTLEKDNEEKAKKDRKKELKEIKKMISNVNSSSKENWEKKLLKRLIMELKE